jgi:hypothetical protein
MPVAIYRHHFVILWQDGEHKYRNYKQFDDIIK